MHKIYFYQDRAGNEPVYDYMQSLKAHGSKDSRIKLNKMRDYIKALSENGTYLPENYCKHLEGDIWELRPISDRVLFAAWVNGSFVLLHVFQKKTQKTPRREIDQAKRELADFKERQGEKNGI